MKKDRYILYGFCVFLLLWGCAKKPESKPLEQKTTQQSPYVFLDFEQEKFNGGWWEENMKDGVDTFKIKRTDLVKHGDRGYSLAIDYNFNLKKDSVGGLWVNVSRLDFTRYSYFGFWVKGEPDLGFTNIIGVTFEDADGHRKTKMFGGVSPNWKKVEVSLSTLQGIDLSKLTEINVIIERRFANAQVGRIYLDDFYLR